MIGLPDTGVVTHFSEVITRRMGLQFDDAKFGFLGEVLHRRLETLNLSGKAYLSALETETRADELAALARELTVGETYFFRNIEQFHALAQVVLPDRMRARATTKALRILCAACASGEEAYSIAMTAQAVIVDPAWTVSVLAVDLNPDALEKARQARYSAWALRETSPEARQKWFRPAGREVVLDDTVMGAVDFQQRNLVADDRKLWLPGAYDVVFCRNVLMYFEPEQMRATIARIATALAPGGYLFLGHAETLRGVSDDFHLRHTHGTFYYERKGSIEPSFAPSFASSFGQLGLTISRPPAKTASPETSDDAWVESIRQASERVGALAQAQVVTSPLALATPATRDLGPVLDLMRKERFGEALTGVRDLPSWRDDDPDSLLLEAMLLAHNGEFSAAEAACRRLLSIDELNAGAHYALALCRENLGDRDGAAEHDRVAVYLDSAFAMPRLHLGLLARRAGDRAGARRDLSHALALLKREDASRLLLFGGGFNRETLMSLCRSALSGCGGRP